MRKNSQRFSNATAGKDRSRYLLQLGIIVFIKINKNKVILNRSLWIDIQMMFKTCSHEKENTIPQCLQEAALVSALGLFWLLTC